MKTATIRSRSVLGYDRLDAHFFTSPGVAAGEKVTLLEATGAKTSRLGDIARVWDPPRFARAYAAPDEPGVSYLRPYDVFDYLPTSSDRLSIARNEELGRLTPAPGTILQTCSGRNLGPCAYADKHIAHFALSHDMIRIEVDDEQLRMYLLVFLKTPTGQALLRRGKSGSVIDHLTVADVEAIRFPLVGDGVYESVVAAASDSVQAAENARARISALLSAQEQLMPAPRRDRPLRDGWSMSSTKLTDRLDAAYYDPLVIQAREDVRAAGGVAMRDLADVILPVRYKRYYVGPHHGRPILSGRQILQVEPINLRWVADRSFRDPSRYVISSGMTIFGADGRAEGSQGAASLVTEERDGWLASNHVMRLRPRPGVHPGALWLATAVRQTRLQINALSFGSVVDQVNPGDIESVLVPHVSHAAALEAHSAWQEFTRATKAMDHAIGTLEGALTYSP